MCRRERKNFDKFWERSPCVWVMEKFKRNGNDRKHKMAIIMRMKGSYMSES